MQIRQEFYRIKREKSQERERALKLTNHYAASHRQPFNNYVSAMSSPTFSSPQPVNHGATQPPSVFAYNVTNNGAYNNNNYESSRERSTSNRLLSKYKTIFGL